MSSTLSGYKNVFNEPATMDNLSHIFDIMNEKNEDRIAFRDFVKYVERIGVPLDSKALRKVYDHIASSVKKQRYLNQETWKKGIRIAHKDSSGNTKTLYTAILSGMQYDPQPNREEIAMDEIRGQIKDTKATWVYRVECMESFCRQITRQNVSKDHFHEQFRGMHLCLTTQARDRRSNVSRVACECLAKVMVRWKSEYLRYSYTTMEYIYELVRQKIKVVHESGYNVLVVLLKNVGDHKECKLMDILGREATTSKFVNLQQDCFDLLLLYLIQQNEQLKSRDLFWSKLVAFTQRGVDDTAEVRNSALRLVAQIEAERPKMTVEIINKMGAHLRKRYESEYRISSGKGTAMKKKEEKKEEEETTASTKSKKASSAKGKKHKSAVHFPKAPDGQWLNGFGKVLTPKDVLFAFQFIDSSKDRKIDLDEFTACCRRLNVSGDAVQLFAVLDEHKAHKVSFKAFESGVTKRDSRLTEFWEKLLSAKGLEMHPFDDDLEFDVAHKLLLNPKSPEDDRLRAMHSITRRICGSKKFEDGTKFEKQFKKSLGPMLHELKDRNHCMMRQLCVCLSKICMAKQALYRPFSVRTLENLCEAIKLQDDMTHHSATQAAMTMIEYVPDRNACPLMKIICTNCGDKNFQILRLASFEFVNYYLFTMIKHTETKKKVFWEYLDSALQSGMTDSDATVRDSAYCALVKVEMLKTDLAAKFIKMLKKTRKEKFDAIKQEELQRIQSNERYQSAISMSSPQSPSTPHSPNIHKSAKKTKSTKSPKSPKSPAKVSKSGQSIKSKTTKSAKSTKANKSGKSSNQNQKQKEPAKGSKRSKSPKKKNGKYAINKRPKDDLSDEEENETQIESKVDPAPQPKAEPVTAVNDESKNEDLSQQKADKLRRERIQRMKEVERQEREQRELERKNEEELRVAPVNEEENERRGLELKRRQKELKEMEKMEREKEAQKEKEDEERTDIMQDIWMQGQKEQNMKRKEEELKAKREKEEEERKEMEEEQALAKRLKAEKAEKERMKQNGNGKGKQVEFEKKEEEQGIEIDAVDDEQKEDDHGLPDVHSAFKAYKEDKQTECSNPTHLVLFAKSKGLQRISFRDVTKYMKESQ